MQFQVRFCFKIFLQISQMVCFFIIAFLVELSLLAENVISSFSTLILISIVSSINNAFGFCPLWFSVLISTRAILSLAHTKNFVKYYIYYEHSANWGNSDSPANCFVLNYKNFTESRIQHYICKLSRAQITPWNNISKMIELNVILLHREKLLFWLESSLKRTYL